MLATETGARYRTGRAAVGLVLSRRLARACRSLVAQRQPLTRMLASGDLSHVPTTHVRKTQVKEWSNRA